MLAVSSTALTWKSLLLVYLHLPLIEADYPRNLVQSHLWERHESLCVCLNEAGNGNISQESKGFAALFNKFQTSCKHYMKTKAREDKKKEQGSLSVRRS